MTYGITNAGGGKSADLGTKTITANDTYLASDDGLDGYSEVTVNVQTAPQLENKAITANGVYRASYPYDGIGEADVLVPQMGSTVIAENLSGGALNQYDKVWVNYKDATQGSSANCNYGSNGQLAFATADLETFIVYDSNYGWSKYTKTGKYQDRANFAGVTANNTYVKFANLYYTIDDLAMHCFNKLDRYNAYYMNHYKLAIDGSFSNDGYEIGGSNDYGYGVTGSGMYRADSGSLTLTKDGKSIVFTDYGGSGYAAYFQGIVKYNNNLYAISRRNNGELALYLLDFDNELATYVTTFFNISSTLHIAFFGQSYNYKYLLFAQQISASATNLLVFNMETMSFVSATGFSGTLSAKPLVTYNPASSVITFMNSESTIERWRFDAANFVFTKLGSFGGDVAGYVGNNTRIPFTSSSLDASIWPNTSGNYYAKTYATSEGWVIRNSASVNQNSYTGYVGESGGIALLNTGDVIIGQRIDGTAITATNNSSYDRQSGEKVWLYKNGSSYQIVDALGLTSNAFTGVCKEAIAIGASGAVQATVGGELVTRWTRDFSVAGAPSVDDGARIVTFTAGYQGVYKVLATGTSIPTTSVTVQLKSKFTGSGSNHNQSRPFAVFGSGYGSSASIDSPLLELVNTKGLYYRIKSGVGNIGAQEKTLLDNSAWVNGKWYWIKLEITDTLVAGYWSEDGTTWNAGPTISGSGLLASFANRTAFGFRSFYDNTTYNGTVDMNESWVKVDGNIVWQPYKPITE